jgi:hypothetical protein
MMSHSWSLLGQSSKQHSVQVRLVRNTSYLWQQLDVSLAQQQNCPSH